MYFLTETLETTPKCTTVSPKQTSRKFNFRKFMEHQNELLERMQMLPYDGMAGKRRKVGVIEALKDSNPKKPNDSNVFNTPFPLLTTLSNRKIFNNNSDLVDSLLVVNKLPLSKAELNTIKYKTYRKSLSPRKEDKRKSSLSKEKIFSKVGEALSVNYDNKKHVFQSDLLEKKNNHENERRLRFMNYLANKANKKFLYDKKDDYILNGYKIAHPDEMLLKIKKDISTLKFHGGLGVMC